MSHTLNEILHEFGYKPISPSEPVPAWAVILHKQVALLIREVLAMKQSTSDLIAATNALVDNASRTNSAIDQLVAAHEDDDDAAVEQAVSQLKQLKTEQDTHLSALVKAAPAVVAAPADQTKVNLSAPVNQAAAGDAPPASDQMTPTKNPTDQ